MMLTATAFKSAVRLQVSPRISPLSRSVRICTRPKVKLRRNVSSSSGQSFKEKAQIDSVVYFGAVALVSGIAMDKVVSQEGKMLASVNILRFYRSLGVESKFISDDQLANDYVKKYMASCINCLLASPAFYFLYHFIHQQGFAVSFARSMTGTVRIVPIMAAMYGTTALVSPLLNAYFQSQGKSYNEASLISQAAVLIGGISILESIVELQGCGVALGNITPAAMLIFVPALIGRIVAGIFVQASKTGCEFKNILPDSWASSEAPAWQRKTDEVFNMLCVDSAFFVTLFGTGVCQHVLNAVTFLLLQKGRGMRVSDVGSYLTGGMGGSAASAAAQFGKTLGMRFGFCAIWNYCSSQPLEFESVDLALETLSLERAAAAAELGEGGSIGTPDDATADS